LRGDWQKGTTTLRRVALEVMANILRSRNVHFCVVDFAVWAGPLQLLSTQDTKQCAKGAVPPAKRLGSENERV